MHKTMPHLNDEHMQMYEWSGKGTEIAFSMPAKSKRAHPWHASYAVLAVLTSLLILNGCDKQDPAERAGEQMDRSVQDVKKEANTLFDEPATKSAPRRKQGRHWTKHANRRAKKIEQLGEDMHKP